jgi:hypothetical protein
MVIGFSSVNYQIMDEESTGGKVISPGVTILWMRNPLDERLNSSRNHQLMDEKSVGNCSFCMKNLPSGNNSRIGNSN